MKTLESLCHSPISTLFKWTVLQADRNLSIVAAFTSVLLIQSIGTVAAEVKPGSVVRVGIWTRAGLPSNGDAAPPEDPVETAQAIDRVVRFDVVVLSPIFPNSRNWKELTRELASCGFKVAFGKLAGHDLAVALRKDTISLVSTFSQHFPVYVRRGLCETLHINTPIYVRFRIGEVEFTVAAVRLLPNSPDEKCGDTDFNQWARDRQTQFILREIEGTQEISRMNENVVIVGNFSAGSDEPWARTLEEGRFELLNDAESGFPGLTNAPENAELHHHIFASPSMRRRWIPSTSGISWTHDAQSWRPVWADFRFGQAK